MAQRASIDSSRNVDYTYEQYLLSNQQVMLEAIRQFEDKLHHSYEKYGRFTIPTFFKPHFISPKQARLVHTACDSIVRMMDRVTDLYLHDPTLKEHFALSPEADELVRMDPGYSRSVAIARLDCFLDGESLRF